MSNESIEVKAQEGKPPYDEKSTDQERIAVIGKGNRLEPTPASLRAAAEEILDYLNFDTSISGVQQDADQIVIILERIVKEPEARTGSHFRAVKSFLQEMVEIYSLDVVLTEPMTIEAVCAELLKQARSNRETLSRPSLSDAIKEADVDKVLQQIVETSAGERIRMKCGAADLRSVIVDILGTLHNAALKEPK